MKCIRGQGAVVLSNIKRTKINVTSTYIIEPRAFSAFLVDMPVAGEITPAMLNQSVCRRCR